MVEERGFCVNKMGGVSPLANGGRPWKREKMRALMVEVGGRVWVLLEIWKRLEFWKLEILWIVEEGKK